MINNKLVFKAKDRYKVELKNYETRNYLAVQKQIIDKIKNDETYQFMNWLT